MVCLGSPGGLAAASRPLEADPQLARLIAQLGADSPEDRETAAQAILARGQAARIPLREAMAGAEPEVRLRLAELIDNLPWHLAEDPPEVVEALVEYPKAEMDMRQHLAARLGEIGPSAAPALLRILDFETRQSVRWVAAVELSSVMRGRTAAEIRRRDVDPKDGPMLLAAAAAARTQPPPARRERVRRACVAALAAPDADDYARIRSLTALSLMGREVGLYAEAAALLRPLIGQTQDKEPFIWDLMCLHAMADLPDYLEDLRLAKRVLPPRLVGYALARRIDRTCGRTWGEAARLAVLAGHDSIEARFAAAEELSSVGWSDWAAGEWVMITRLRPDQTDVYVANAFFRLAAASIGRGEAWQAARRLEQGLAAMPEGVQLARTTVDAVRSEAHYRYLVHGREKGDQAEVGRRLDQIVALKAAEPSITMELVPMLKQAGRTVDARAMYERCYDIQKRQLADDPANAELKNNFAWFLAHCEEALDEAFKLGSEAVAAEPDNAAYIDTLAEVNFRLGRLDEAVRLARRALELRPDDDFLQKQLRRFESAAKSERQPTIRP